MRLLGRESERRRIEAAFAAGERAVVLVGPAGVGKTAIARSFEDAVIAEANAATRDDLLAAIARAASVASAAPDPRVFLERLATALDAREALVVIDGGERARDIVRDATIDLLELTQRTRVLVTSRNRIDLPDELVVSVKPLARAAAIELLEDELRLRASDQRRIDRRAAEELCERAGDRPLAIQLVAARVASLGVESALRVFDATTDGSTDVLDRVFDSSWALLDEADQRALESLRVFRGGFDLAAASAVLATDARAVVERLLSASLLGRAGDDRFDLPETVRAHLLGELDVGARERHAEHFSRIASARADDRATWARLSLERENLIAAFRASTCAPERAAKIAAVLDPILVTAGPAKLHEEVLATALAAFETADVCIALGRHHGLRGKHAIAAELFTRALRLAERDTDEGRLGWAEAFLAFSLRPLARFDDAITHARSALGRARRLEDVRLDVMAEQTLGLIAFDREDLALAEQHFRRALATARNADAPRLEGIVHANLAVTALYSKALDASDEHARLARHIFERIDDRLHLVRVGHVEALVAVERSDLARAEPLLRVLLDTSLEHGDLDGEVNARSGLARLAAAQGDARLASLRLDEARAVAERTDDVVERGRLERLARKIESPKARAVVVVTRDGRSIAVDGNVIDLSKRGPSRRLVLALVEHRLGLLHRDRDGLDVDAMLAAGWPGERMRAESGAARVYMAVRRLREIGLEPILRTNEHGYSLDRDVDVSWADPER